MQPEQCGYCIQTHKFLWRLKRLGLSSKPSWLGGLQGTFLSPWTCGKGEGAVQAVSRHWAWKSCLAADVGQAHETVTTSHRPKALIWDRRQVLILEGLTNLPQKLMLFFLLPTSSLPPHVLQDLKTAAQSFPSHLVSVFHYSLLFHLKKVSFHLSCLMLLLIRHQFIQLLHIQLTDTPSVGLPLKQMLFRSGANNEKKNNSQYLMLEAHLKPVFFWISKAK